MFSFSSYFDIICYSCGLSILIYCIISVYVYILNLYAKLISYYENNTIEVPCLDSYPIYNKTVSSENLIICTGGQEYFKAQLFYLKRTWFILSCFLLNSVFLLYGFLCVCVCWCLSNIKREIESFSLFVNFPDHGNGRFRVLKLVATVHALERGRLCKKLRADRGAGGGGATIKQNERRSEWLDKCYLSEEFFRDIVSFFVFFSFLTMHLASCYSLKVTLNNCFILCCKRFFKNNDKKEKMQSVSV